jgi:hypothetical protein
MLRRLLDLAKHLALHMAPTSTTTTMTIPLPRQRRGEIVPSSGSRISFPTQGVNQHHHLAQDHGKKQRNLQL